MISVLIKPENKFDADPEKIWQIASRVLEKENLGQEVEVSIAFVSSSQMQKLNQKYRHLDQPTTVLTFSQQTGRAFRFPDEILRLGDIVICPKEAQRQNLTIESLIIHAIQNLLSEIPTTKNLRT